MEETRLKRPGREREAFEAIGRTEVRRSHALLLVGSFLTALVAGTVASFVPADARNAAATLGIAVADAARAGAGAPTLEGLLAGNDRLLATLDQVESGFEDASPWRRTTLGTVQRLLATWGGVGNEQVTLGTSGRLAFRPGVDYVLGRPFLSPSALGRRRAATASWLPPVAPDPRPALIAFHRQLAERGIRLVLMPVPAKPMVDPAAVGMDEATADRVAGAGLHNPSFAQLANDLAAEGIDVFDPIEALIAVQRSGVDAYLRSDSHWSPAGMSAVAQTLADHLETLGLDLGPPRSWHRSPATATGWGDLARMLVTEGETPFSAPETIALDRVTAADGSTWRAEGEATILLLGDSFTNVFSVEALGWGASAGLAEQLAYALGRAVDRMAVDGGGASQSRERLARILTQTPRLAGKRALVFQVAVRELTSGDWRPVTLPAPAETPPSSRPRPGPARVTATVAAVSSAPRPGATPYREALVALYLVDIRSASETQPRRALAYAWGLRDNQPAGGSRLRAGQRVEGVLVPWSVVAPDLESIQRVELDDPALLALETFFLELP